MLATVVGGEERPKPIGGASAQVFEDPGTRLVYVIRPAVEGMRHATAALFSPDHPAADDIDAAYEALLTLHHELEDQTAAHMAARARSAVAGLAATVAAVHINAEAESMGQPTREVADIARTRRAWASIPAPLLGSLRKLSEVCLDMAFKAANVVESHGEVGVAEVDRGDEVDRLEQALFAQLPCRLGSTSTRRSTSPWPPAPTNDMPSMLWRSHIALRCSRWAHRGANVGEPLVGPSSFIPHSPIGFGKP